MKELTQKRSNIRSWVANSKRKINDFIDHPITIAVLGVVTIYALLADDIRQLSGNNKTDIGFDVVTFIVFALFMFEIILSCYGKPKYICR